MTDQTEDDPTRAFARALFAPDPDEPTDEPTDEPKPPVGNFVPKEGNNPKTVDRDQVMRELNRNLFDRDPNA